MDLEGLLIYARIIGYFLAATLTFYSVPLMRVTWFVPMSTGLFFSAMGLLTLFASLGLSEAADCVRSYILSPLMFLVCISTARGMWKVNGLQGK